IMRDLSDLFVWEQPIKRHVLDLAVPISVGDWHERQCARRPSPVVFHGVECLGLTKSLACVLGAVVGSLPIPNRIGGLVDASRPGVEGHAPWLPGPGGV